MVWIVNKQGTETDQISSMTGRRPFSFSADCSKSAVISSQGLEKVWYSF